MKLIYQHFWPCSYRSKKKVSSQCSAFVHLEIIEFRTVKEGGEVDGPDVIVPYIDFLHVGTFAERVEIYVF